MNLFRFRYTLFIKCIAGEINKSVHSTHLFTEYIDFDGHDDVKISIPKYIKDRYGKQTVDEIQNHSVYINSRWML